MQWWVYIIPVCFAVGYSYDWGDFFRRGSTWMILISLPFKFPLYDFF